MASCIKLQKVIARLRRLRPQSIMMGVAIAVLGLGVLVTTQALFTNHTAKTQFAGLATKSKGGGSLAPVPSEKKPSSSTYQVAPNLPKYIKISKLNINARVKALGVDGNNQLKAPNNIYDAGWYDASARPGDSGSLGAIMVSGHVHGPSQPGVFVGLKKLALGDDIQIVRGDDRVFQYKVVKVQNFDAATMDMGMMLSSAQPGKPGLNLITCGGPYNRKTGEYTQRTVVFAVQV